MHHLAIVCATGAMQHTVSRARLHGLPHSLLPIGCVGIDALPQPLTQPCVAVGGARSQRRLGSGGGGDRPMPPPPPGWECTVLGPADLPDAAALWRVLLSSINSSGGGGGGGIVSQSQRSPADGAGGTAEGRGAPDDDRGDERRIRGGDREGAGGGVLLLVGRRGEPPEPALDHWFVVHDLSRVIVVPAAAAAAAAAAPATEINTDPPRPRAEAENEPAPALGLAAAAVVGGGQTETKISARVWNYAGHGGEPMSVCLGADEWFELGWHSLVRVRGLGGYP
jgi:hypothetical protein